MLIEKTWRAIKILFWPNPEKPLGGGCRGFVAEIKHCHKYDNETADNHFGDFVFLAKFADDCPSENTYGVEMQDTKGDKETGVHCYAQNVGDK